MNKVFPLLAILTVGCGGLDTGNPSNFYLDAASKTAPVISGNALSFSEIQNTSALTLPTGSVLYEINRALEEYEFPRDEGRIDSHNIYKTLTTSGQGYMTAQETCGAITEKVINAPFDLGLNGQTYDCAVNSGSMTEAYPSGLAIRESDNTKYSLLAFRWAPDPDDQEGHGVLHGSYNESTKELNLRMVNITEYGPGDGFVVRSHITGNAETHSFTLSLITSTIASSGKNWTSFVGKGVSRGSGNYFLFKVSNSSGVNGNYICFSAETTASELESIHNETPEGKTTVDSNCSQYQADVDAMTMLTTSDVPESISDFTNSSIHLEF